MAKEIQDIEQISLSDYVVGGNDKRSWFYAEQEAWLREKRANPGRFESFVYSWVMIVLSSVACVITVIVALANGYGLSQGTVGTFSSALLFGAGHALWLRRLYRKEAARLAAIPQSRREWSDRLLLLVRKVEGFNGRLNAFKLYASNADPGQEVDPTVIEKYDAERLELTAFRRQLLREQALTEFEAASNGDDTGFRETRDLSDAIFMTKLRIEGAGQEKADVLASPDEERFRALEEQEQQAVANASGSSASATEKNSA